MDRKRIVSKNKRKNRKWRHRRRNVRLEKVHVWNELLYCKQQ